MLCVFVCFFISYTEFSPIYESIHFDAAAAAAFTKITTAINSNKASATATSTDAKNTDLTETIAHPLQRQNAFDGGVDRVVKRKQSDERDVRDFLDRCIPPPPVTSPPPAPTLDSDSDSDNTEQVLDDDPVQISHRTLMKLNSLYSVYKMRRSDCTETDEADEPLETNETTDDVVLRLHNKVDKCKSRLFRGSSKAMCSFVSVRVVFHRAIFCPCFFAVRFILFLIRLPAFCVFFYIFRMWKMIIYHDWMDRKMKASTMTAMTMAVPIQRQRTESLGSLRMTHIAEISSSNSRKNQFIRRTMKFTFDRITKFQLDEWDSNDTHPPEHGPLPPLH